MGEQRRPAHAQSEIKAIVSTLENRCMEAVNCLAKSESFDQTVVIRSLIWVFSISFSTRLLFDGNGSREKKSKHDCILLSTTSRAFANTLIK